MTDDAKLTGKVWRGGWESAGWSGSAGCGRLAWGGGVSVVTLSRRKVRSTQAAPPSSGLWPVSSPASGGGSPTERSRRHNAPLGTLEPCALPTSSATEQSRCGGRRRGRNGCCGRCCDATRWACTSAASIRSGPSCWISTARGQSWLWKSMVRFMRTGPMQMRDGRSGWRAKAFACCGSQSPMSRPDQLRYWPPSPRPLAPDPSVGTSSTACGRGYRPSAGGEGSTLR